MIKAAEHKPPIHNLENNQENYIDLNKFSKEYDLQNPLAKIFYLDKIGDELLAVDKQD